MGPKDEEKSEADDDDDDDDVCDELPDHIVNKAYQNKGARQSVSAEAYGAWNQKKDFVPKKIPKSPEQKKRLQTVLSKSFLFAVLDEKDFDVLIDALAVLRPGIEVRAIVLGEGEERAALQARINEADLADRVVLPGFVANPFAAMARADVFVLSSRQETFGNVLVEAMSLGVPVIATRCPGGPGEILEDGRWGTLVPEEDAEALAQAILDVLRTGGIDARARARDFRLESVAPRYQAVVFPFTGEAD